VFQEQLLKAELAAHKLRDAVIALRSYYLTHHKAPSDENLSEQWKSSLLCEAATEAFEASEAAQADLLRYGYELVPRDGTSEQMSLLQELKAAHALRLKLRSGHSESEPHPRGIEEKVSIDSGPPVTVVIHPKHYEFTEKARRAREQRARREAAMDDPPDNAPTDVM
jgi:hypothetical protein